MTLWRGQIGGRAVAPAAGLGQHHLHILLYFLCPVLAFAFRAQAGSYGSDVQQPHTCSSVPAVPLPCTGFGKRVSPSLQNEQLVGEDQCVDPGHQDTSEHLAFLCAGFSVRCDRCDRCDAAAESRAQRDAGGSAHLLGLCIPLLQRSFYSTFPSEISQILERHELLR